MRFELSTSSAQRLAVGQSPARRAAVSAVASRLAVALIVVLTSLAMTVATTRPAIAAHDPIIAAAGDYGCDPLDPHFNNLQGTTTPDYCHEKQTSDLLAAGGFDAVLPLGDQHYCGSLAEYQQAYDPTWGRLNSISHPIPGNHEYLTDSGSGQAIGCDSTNANAAGYFGYFGATAGTSGQGWYSYNLGGWHLIALNSNCGSVGGCGLTSPQGKWLAADLAAHPNQCTLAYFHQPLFSSGGRASSNGKSFWQMLYAAHADVVLDGHDHIYERFDPQDSNGVADLSGIREFIVGTGGANHTSIGTVAANSVVRNADTFGILALTLHGGGYDWNFEPVPGRTFTDSGSAKCHSAGSATNPPGPPTAVSASAGNASALVSWTAPSDNGGSPISAYTVTSSPDGKTCATTGATSCTVSGLTNGQPTTFTVVAANGAGPGSPSAASAPVTPSGPPPTNPPGPPTAVSASAGNASALVSWTAPSDNGGSPISAYTVTSSPDGKTCATTGATSCTVSGLTNGQPTTFTVVAANGAGPGSPSAASAPVTPSGPPPIGGTLTFNPVADSYVDASAATTNYGKLTTLRIDASPVVRSYLKFTVSGISGSIVSATLRVYANTAQTTGYDAYSVADTSWVETAITSTNAPPFGTTKLGSSGKITAGTWTSVNVTAAIAGNGTFGLGISTTNSTAVSLSSREGANAPQLVIVTSGPPPTNPPGPPTAVSASAGNASALVSWTAPSDNGGSPISAYTVTSSPDGKTCATTGATSCTVSGLTNGQPTTFTVVAANGAGPGSPSAASAPVTPSGPPPTNPPGPPTAVSASAGNASALVSWTAPSDNGGSPISAYTVTSSPDGKTCATTGATSCTVSGLTNGQPTTFTVVAANGAGPGSPSAASAPVTPSGPPPIGGTLTFNPVADSYVDASAATTNYGKLTTLRIDASPVVRSYLKFTVSGISGSIVSATLRVYANTAQTTGYDAYSVADTSWVETAITSTNAPPFGTTKLGSSGKITAGTWTSVNVTAAIAGNGTFGLGISTTNSTAVSLSSREGANAPQLVIVTSGPPPTNPPGPPTAVSASAGNASALVSWTAPSDNGGSPISAYTVTSSPDGKTCATTGATSCTVSGLTNGQPTTFTVVAANGAGPGSPSAASAPVTPSGPPPTSADPLRAAFYYPWFAEAWNQQGMNPFTHYNPSLGFYDGADAAVVAGQIHAMQYGKISVGIASWWGHPSSTDAKIPTLLSAAAGTGFKWAIYYEPEGTSDPSVAQIQSDLAYINSHYGSNAATYGINGRPVIFVYADPADGCSMASRWAQANASGADYIVLKVFAGYATCADQPNDWHQYAPAVAEDQQTGHSFTISPGYYKANETNPSLARDQAAWTQEVRDMVASGEPWQLITTFNEWGEGTSVESAAEWSSASGYGIYLDALHDN